jgi:hypothetical protein
MVGGGYWWYCDCRSFSYNMKIRYAETVQISICRVLAYRFLARQSDAIPKQRFPSRDSQAEIPRPFASM